MQNLCWVGTLRSLHSLCVCAQSLQISLRKIGFQRFLSWGLVEFCFWGVDGVCYFYCNFPAKFGIFRCVFMLDL